MLAKMKHFLSIVVITFFSFSASCFAAKTVDVDVYNKANLTRGQVWSATLYITDNIGNGHGITYIEPWYDLKHHDSFTVDSIKTTEVYYCMGTRDKCSDGYSQSCPITDNTSGNYNHIDVYLFPNNNCYAVTQ